MRKRIALSIVALFLLLSTVNLYADNKDYYKLSEKELKAVDLNESNHIYSLNFQAGKFDLFSYNDTHDLIIYDDDPNEVYAIKKYKNNIITFPANGEKLKLFFAKTDKTSTGRAWGFMDENGKVVVEAIYELGGNMFGGVADVGMLDSTVPGGMRFGLVNEKGEVITDIKYKYIERFRMPNSFINQDTAYTFYTFKSKYFTDYKPVKYAVFYEDDPDAKERYVIRTQRYYKFPKPNEEYGGKKGIIDNTGKERQAAIYDDVRIGDNDIIAVKNKDSWGYINPDGKMLLPIQYSLVTRFRDGKAAIVKNNEIAFIDENFNILQDFTPAPYWNDLFYIGDIDSLTLAYYDKTELPYSEWASEYVNLADSLGVLSDNIKKNYKKNISREEFCEIIMETIYRNANNKENDKYEWQKKQMDEAIAKVKENPFKDTDNDYVKLAYHFGLVKGKDKEHFVPKGEITRQEAATILVRAYKICWDSHPEENKMNYYKEDELKNLYNDVDKIADWAKESVYYAKSIKVMNGVGDKNFNPLGRYTVEQAITTIIRLYEEI